MGLFKRELNKAVKRTVRKAVTPTAPSKPKVQPTVISATPWTFCPPMFQAVKIGGDYENIIYVYDSEPLNKVKEGQTVPVEIYCGDMVLYSKASGNAASSAEWGDTVVLYNGQPIGFTTFPRDKVMEAARMGYILWFDAKCCGMLEGYRGIKEMRLIAPNPFYLYDWIPGAPDDRPLYMKDEYFSFNEYDEEDFKNIAIKDEWVFQDARIEMIPTPKGSSAKPHIGIYSSDGMQVSEVAAKNNCYNGLIGFMGKYKGFTVKATRQKSVINDGSYYRIEIIGK